MNERTKKILIIAVFILSVFGIGTALYYAFFRVEATPPDATVTPPKITDGSQGFPSGFDGAPTIISPDGETIDGLIEADEVASGGLTEVTELTSSPVFQTVISSDGKGINYYNDSDNRFYRIDETGQVEKLSDKQFPNVQNATWDKDSTKAILEFPDGSNIVYDFDAETQVTLPKHWEDFDFSPVRDEIIAKSIALDPNNRWLLTTNSDGSNVRTFQALGENEKKVDVSWSPNDQVIAFADTSDTPFSDIDRKVIYPIGKNDENFKGLVIEGLNFSSKWSPSGKKLLYSVSGSYSNYKPLLWIVDATASTMGENRQSLGINTWVEKCSWSSATTFYCAVPQSLPSNAGLQPSLYASTPDNIFKVDIATGRSELIAIPESDKSMSNLSISSDESLLYYTNTLSGQLEVIKLK